MRKTLLAFFLVCVAVVAGHAQLLSTDIAFPTDASTIVVTVDANKGNKGLLNHTASDVYVHTGVITNLSTGPTNWRYVKFNQNFNQPNPNNPYPPYGGGFGGMQMALPNATIVLVLGILSIVTCCCFYGLIGLVLGIVALILSRKDKQNYLANMNYYTQSSYKNLNAGRVCSIIGLTLSGLILLICIVFAIFFGFNTLTDEETLKQFLRELQ